MSSLLREAVSIIIEENVNIIYYIFYWDNID